MKLNKRRTLTFAFHTLFWLLPIIFAEMQDADFVLGVFRKKDFQIFYPLYYGVALNMVIFYGSLYFLMPRVQKHSGMVMAVVNALFLYAIVTIMEVGIDTLVVKNHEVSNHAEIHHIILADFLLNFMMMPIVIGYFFMQNWMNTDKKRRILREENLRMEVQFLKSQINPHFLFNTLNNLYVSARKNNDMPTAEGISQLSGMMRYMIYDTNVEYITLSKEVEYLKNYIELQKRRFSASDPINIQFDVNGDVAQVAVAPMLLIPFVENAFKHGISLKKPSYIHMELNVLPGHFTFTVKNSIFKKTNQAQEGGIGLENVKRRLELLYSDRYELKAEAEKDTFITILNINTLQK